tara:strand:- start:1617 stop:2585 length:969 start_codon:yes stop_codon:yes gene_type:complete
MKILVTGGAGYVGSVTTHLLCNQLNEVIVFDNLERGFRSAVDPRALFINGDLRNKKDILNAIQTNKPDAIIHFAGYIEVGESMKNPKEFTLNNVGGTKNLINAMIQSSCKKVIFSSTCAVYGTPDVVPLSETLPHRPQSVYAENKSECERLFLEASNKHNLECVFLRYFNASGATETYGESHNPETHLIPLILQVALNKRKEISIYGNNYDTIDGTCIRDYIHIEDLATAHILALRKGISGAFNLGNGNGYSVKQVIDVCRKITNHPIPSKVVSSREGDSTILISDSSKAKNDLGWTPKYPDLESIITSAWKWHKSHPDGYS